MSDVSNKNKRLSVGKVLRFILKPAFLIFLLAVIFAAAAFRGDLYVLFGLSADTRGDFSVSFINVGSADCCLVKCDGEAALIDCGSALVHDKIYSYLKRADITNLSFAVVSHPDSDHIGSLPTIIDEFHTDKIYVTEYASGQNSIHYQRLVNSAKENNSVLEKVYWNQIVKLGSAEICFYPPGRDYDDSNDNSLVARLDYRGKSFLFTGDISSDREEDMLNSLAEINCDVLKVAHHGANTSSSSDFLAAVSPDIAVINASQDDPYHPNYNVLSRLNEFCGGVYMTSTDKTVVITLENNSLSVKTKA